MISSSSSSSSATAANDPFLAIIQDKINQLNELSNKLTALAQENKKAQDRITLLEMEKNEMNKKLVSLEQRIDLYDPLPLGTILIWSSLEIPKKFLVCDGRELPRKGEYAPLFDEIGTHYGQGDKVRTFNIPNFQGRFVQGADGDDVIGSIGDATDLSHQHKGQVNINCTTSAAGAHRHIIVNKEGTPVYVRWTGGHGNAHSLLDTFGTNNDDRVYTDNSDNHVHNVVATGDVITDTGGKYEKLRPKWASALYIIKVLP